MSPRPPTRTHPPHRSSPRPAHRPSRAARHAPGANAPRAPRLDLPSILLLLAGLLLLPAAAVSAGLGPAADGADLETTGEVILATQPPEVRERVLRGEITPVAPHPGLDFQALLVFERPVERVSELLRQTQRQMEFRKDLKQSATLAVFQDGALQRQRMRFGFFDFVVHLRYVVDDTGRRIHWTLDERFDNDLQRLHGYWELHPLGASRTLARFGSRIELALPTPQRVKRRATLTDIERVRRWVDSEGTWRP